jgi:hypothetical protein
MTTRCINSINSQSYKNLQKILVNAGSPPHQTQDLKLNGAKLDDWIILEFPIDCMDMEDSWQSQRWNGKAALHITNGNYFFALNDDDFLSNDFFSKIAKNLLIYPDAGAAIGLRVEFNHSTEQFGMKTLPLDSYGNPRPIYESGLNVVRELFFKNNLAYGPSLGFQPVLKTELIKEIGPNFFYKGFYPDHASYFQIVSRTNIIFDYSAEMYWGIHEDQDHNKWDEKIYWKCNHENVFKSFMNENYKIFKVHHPENSIDLRNLRKYYKTKIVSYSLFAITSRYKNLKKLAPNIKKSKSPHDLKFPLFKHLRVLVKRPIILFQIIVKVFYRKLLKVTL